MRGEDHNLDGTHIRSGSGTPPVVAWGVASWLKPLVIVGTNARETPSNNKMKLTKPATDRMARSSQLILVFDGR